MAVAEETLAAPGDTPDANRTGRAAKVVAALLDAPLTASGVPPVAVAVLTMAVRQKVGRVVAVTNRLRLRAARPGPCATLLTATPPVTGVPLRTETSVRQTVAGTLPRCPGATKATRAVPRRAPDPALQAADRTAVGSAATGRARLRAGVRRAAGAVRVKTRPVLLVGIPKPSPGLARPRRRRARHPA